MSTILATIGKYLLGFVVFPVLGFLLASSLRILERRQEKKIQDNARKNLDDVLRTRRKIKRIRTVFKFLHLTLYPATFVIAVASALEKLTILTFGSAILTAVAIRGGLRWSAGPISTMKVSDILNDSRPFILYLRAFKSDNSNDSFLEADFAQRVENQYGMHIYAVGLPEEIDSPQGAKRVYLKEDTWPNDVLNLMQRAELIYLRVCNTDPCRWEMKQAMLMIEKVKLIVDRVEEYEATLDELPHNLPKLEPLSKGFYLLEIVDNNKWTVSTFKHSNYGYKDVSSPDKEEKFQRELKRQNGWFKAFIVLLICICVGYLAFEIFAPKYSLYYYSNSYPNEPRKVESISARNDSLADACGRAKWEETIKTMASQYNGSLAHDDSLDKVMPASYIVVKRHDVPHDPLFTRPFNVNKGDVFPKQEDSRFWEGKWRISADSLMQQLRFYGGIRTVSRYHLSRRNEDYTVSLIESEDTLANIHFDLFMFFVDDSKYGLEKILMLSSNEYLDNSSLENDLGKVCLVLRRKYGIAERGHTWICKEEHSLFTSSITCDSVSIGNHKMIMIKDVYDLNIFSKECDSLILSRYTLR